MKYIIIIMIRLNSVVVYCLWNELLRHPATGSKTCKMNEWTNHNKSSVQTNETTTWKRYKDYQ